MRSSITMTRSSHQLPKITKHELQITSNFAVAIYVWIAAILSLSFTQKDTIFRGPRFKTKSKTKMNVFIKL